jgi:hypothetical protein
MIYACTAWEFAAHTHLLKLQRLQNKVLRIIGNFPRRTTVRELYKAFNFSYIYDYTTKLCRQQAEIIQNHGNAMSAIWGKVKADTENIKSLKFGGGQAYDRSNVLTALVA